MSSSKLEIAAILSMPFAENSYIAHLQGRDDCLIFDPGFEPDAIVEYVEAHGLTPAAILCTHGHGDHIGGNQFLKERWPECPLLIGVNDAPLLSDPYLNMSGQFGLGIVSPPADRLLTEGELFEGAGLALDVREIPGHSPGHVVFVWHEGTPKQVFGGDVLFRGSIGRTDFPGGDFPLLHDGIHKKLFDLPDDTIVHPGHGPATTIGEEKAGNPFVGLDADFDG